MHCTKRARVLKLVVVEREALVSSEVLTPSERLSHVVVVAQAAGETLESFAERIAQRLTRLESTGHSVVEAAIAVGACSGRGASAARVRLGRTVFTHLSGVATELVFFGGSAPPDTRHELLVLGGSLGATGGGGRVSVKLGPARGGLPARSGPGVSSGDTQAGMFSAGSAIDLASGYAGVSREGHREARSG